MDRLTATLCAVLRDGPAPELWRGWGDDDWHRLVATARSHSVEALLQRALAAGGWPAEMPAAARNTLRAYVYESTGHNLRVYGALAAILSAVGPATPLVVLKGAALGAGLYPSPGLRPFTDLDLLAPAERVESVAAVLRGLGFRPKPSMAPELAREVDPHLVLVGGADDSVFVELHWNLVAGGADWRSVPVDWFWQHTEPWQAPAAHPASAGAAQARQLTPTATLLYQCAHLVLQHGPFAARLIWVYDLHLLVSRASIDWAELITQAQRLGWGEVVYTALDQARSCFGTDLSAVPIAALRGRLHPRARFSGVGEPNPHRYDTWDTLLELSLPTRLRLLARVVFPSRRWVRADYEPRWGKWWPLAYPYRWLKPLRNLAAPATRHTRRARPTTHKP